MISKLLLDQFVCLSSNCSLFPGSDIHNTYDLILIKEKHLRALQFLPDIVEMVAVLDEVCSYRLDRKTAKAMPISSYSKDYLPVGMYL